MALSSLCEYCQQIDFAQLRCPTVAQLTQLGTGTSLGPMVNFDAGSSHSKPVSLGTLTRVKKSTAKCSVCALIWRVMVRNNYGEEPDTHDESSGDREKECFAFISTYGKFTDSASDQHDFDPEIIGLQNLVRRLSLRIGVPPGHDEDDADCFWWEILFCIQGCAANDFVVHDVDGNDKLQTERSLVFGGRRRPLIVDYAQLRRWLQICDRNHVDVCGQSVSMASLSLRDSSSTAQSDCSRGVYPDLRLINVSRKCLEAFNAQPGPLPPYVALSYVWGKDQRIKLRTTNERGFMEVGAFEEDAPSQTIVDAIELVERLALPGMKHLWVDALCIVQDSDEDKQRQIGKMGQIYKDATFTIVASAGDDADAGLPGIRPDSRKVEQAMVPVLQPEMRTYGADGLIYHEHGLAIVETLNPLTFKTDEFWALSKYSTRGWCMQEKVLSTRSLIFTEEQVYWQCAAGTYCEESHTETLHTRFRPTYSGAIRYSVGIDNTKQLIDSKQPTLKSSKAFWSNFSALANRFSGLEFSFEGDVLDGFSGITSTLQDVSGERFIWGMPTSRMSLALLWEDSDSSFPDEVPIRRRMERTTLPVSSLRKRLRIPSWSWQGWSGIVELNLGDDEAHLRVPQLIPYVHVPGATSIVRLGYDTSTAFPYEPCPENTAKFAKTPWRNGVKTDVSLSDIAEHLPSLNQILPTVPEEILLFFWTSSSAFRIWYHEDGPRVITTKPSLSPDASSWICSKGPSLDGQDYYWVGSMFSKGDIEYNKSVRHRAEEGPFDYIVVGCMTNAAVRTLIVMLIGFHGDVAMRLGLGTISEDAWMASQPEWKLVALG